MRHLSSIRHRLEKARNEGRAAFIPFFMAGDPDLKWTAKTIRGAIRSGADIIELGVPFSDPVADGEVNQRAAERALASGTNLTSILKFVFNIRQEGLNCPIVLFTYLNPLLRMGLSEFAKNAREAGIDGVLVVDLPPEESADYIRVMRQNQIDTVFLAAPTTSPNRLKLIDAASTGFVYYVSRLGVTGKKTELSQSLAQELDRVRQHVSQPVAVGFGVSTPEQVKSLAAHVDAIVVGSALVKLNEHLAPDQACKQIELACQKLVDATHLT